MGGNAITDEETWNFKIYFNAASVGKYDFNFLAPCPASGIVINADKDPLVEVNLIKDVVKRLNQQKTIDVKQEVIKSSDHFFNNNENKVIEK